MSDNTQPSQNPQSSGGPDGSPQGGEKPHYITPEFIIIDDREKPDRFRKGHPFDEGAEPKDQAEQTTQTILPLRFCCFLGLVFCTIFGLGMLLLSLVLSVLSVLTLFQNKEVNQGVKKFWRIFANTAVAGFGFILGLINPTLGLGLLVLYFSLSGEKIDSDLLRKILQRSVNNL